MKKNKKNISEIQKVKRIHRFIIEAVCLLLITFFIVIVAMDNKSLKKDETAEDSGNKVFDLWYSYTGYETYLKEAAKRYEAKTGVKVRLTYMTTLDYLDKIHELSSKGEGPDLFLMSEESLQNAILLGIVDQNFDDKLLSISNYGEKALDSITYADKKYGYPLGFETSVMVTNMDYTNKVPNSFDEIKNYADSFNNQQEDEETKEEESSVDYSKVTDIFKHDVNKILLNYGFLGAYMNVGGPYGDNSEVIDVNNSKAIAAGEYYYSIAEYFYTELSEISYDDIMNDFFDGKIVYTLATTDVIQRIAQSDMNVKLSVFPKLSDTLNSKQASVTDIIMVNPYADMKDEANEFAKLLSYDMAEEMYDICGIISTRNIEYENENLNIFYDAYEMSTGFPKLMTTADYWLKVTNVMKNIWTGENVTEKLNELFESLDTRIN